MIVLSLRKFKEQSASGINSSERIYQGKSFKEGPVFSLANPRAAQLYCMSYSQKKNGALCILVKETNFFRIWSESSLENKGNVNTSSSVSKPQEISLNSFPVEAQFIDICQKSLATYIGPISKLICKKALAKNGELTRKEFVEILANKIADQSQAKEFIQELLQ